jgi:predicted DNA-binding WGR domain protein
MLPETKRETGRYEFKDEHEHKFWEGMVEGKAVTFRFGKVGTSGLRASREFTTTQSAEEFLEMRLQKKINEGYRLVSSSPMS